MATVTRVSNYPSRPLPEPGRRFTPPPPGQLPAPLRGPIAPHIAHVQRAKRAGGRPVVR